MCGILIYNKDSLPGIKLNHRGIISSSTRKEDWVLEHRLLPIQTNNEKGLQPIQLKGDRYLLFNGEIFNFYKFGDYTNDTSYLKDFFDDLEWRKNINEINRWCGFWSIVIYEEKGFTAFTDPLGKKQLYYNEYMISSEIKPLLRNNPLLGTPKLLQPTGNTPFLGVRRIKPNRIYRLQPHLKTRVFDVYITGMKYYNIYKNESKESLYQRMQNSTQDRLINKMDGITMFVSGGLDSTIILHHLLESPIPNNKIELLTIENGEEEYIEIIEKYYNVSVRRIPIEENLYREAILSYEHYLDYGSLLPQYCLFKNSSNTVVLTGDGADELFSGYNRAQLWDTQKYDVRTELPYYHHIRLDRCSMVHTKEARNPFLSKDVISYAMNCAYKKRKGKKVLKDNYMGYIPKQIIERKKLPLRDGNKDLCRQKAYREFVNIFKGYNNP